MVRGFTLNNWSINGFLALWRKKIAHRFILQYGPSSPSALSIRDKAISILRMRLQPIDTTFTTRYGVREVFKQLKEIYHYWQTHHNWDEDFTDEILPDYCILSRSSANEPSQVVNRQSRARRARIFRGSCKCKKRLSQRTMLLRPCWCCVQSNVQLSLQLSKLLVAVADFVCLQCEPHSFLSPVDCGR